MIPSREQTGSSNGSSDREQWVIGKRLNKARCMRLPVSVRFSHNSKLNIKILHDFSTISKFQSTSTIFSGF